MQVIYMINTVYAANIDGGDPSIIAGLMLGTTVLEILIIYILVGLNGALVTLVAQAKGDDKIALCGVYLNRARLINSLCFVPLMFLVIFVAYFFQEL